jgi:hypothetical protein
MNPIVPRLSWWAPADGAELKATLVGKLPYARQQKWAWLLIAKEETTDAKGNTIREGHHVGVAPVRSTYPLHFVVPGQEVILKGRINGRGRPTIDVFHG